ncbi:hypothetical protein BHM03_00012683, partial [Ensete ventricosum]
VQDIEKQIEKLSKLLQSLQQDANDESKTVVKAAAMKVFLSESMSYILNMHRSLKKKLKEKMTQFQVMDTLAEIQERHDAVRDIEKKLLELQQVNRAGVFVSSGVNALSKAKILQKNSRKSTSVHSNLTSLAAPTAQSTDRLEISNIYPVKLDLISYRNLAAYRWHRDGDKGRGGRRWRDRENPHRGLARALAYVRWVDFADGWGAVARSRKP